MSFEWSSKPLPISSIVSQYTLPVVIRPALGFRGSSQPIILHSSSNVTFAFGRVLKAQRVRNSEYQSYAPVNSEIVAVPLKYPGYFECLSASHRGSEDGVIPDKNIRPIVEQMLIDHRPKTFYISTPLRVFTIEANDKGTINRVWHQIEAHQLIVFDQLTYVEYTPTQDDDLTDDDYALPWWFCIFRYVENRTEHVIKCNLSNDRICYISCLSTDEVFLIPVGQPGSTNAHKLQTIQNLLEYFPLPINIRLAQLPGSDVYKDFNGHLRLFGSHTEDFVVCASLSSTNVSIISAKLPLKFIVASIPVSSPEITKQLSRCQMFIQSFDKQIRRIVVSSSEVSSNSRSRSRSQSAMNRIKEDDQTSSTDDVLHSKVSTDKRRNGFRKQRAISVDADTLPSRQVIKRTLSTGGDSAYNSLVHPIRTKPIQKQSSLPIPPPLPKKPANSSHRSSSFTYDTGSNIIKDMDVPNADGAILIDKNNNLFSKL